MAVGIICKPARGLIAEAAGAFKSEVQLHKRWPCAMGLLMGSLRPERSILSGRNTFKG